MTNNTAKKTKFNVGDVVEAVKPITEGSWVHAEKGDTGEVIYVAPYRHEDPFINHGCPTVRFHKSRSATVIFDEEVTPGDSPERIFESEYVK